MPAPKIVEISECRILKCRQHTVVTSTVTCVCQIRDTIKLMRPILLNRLQCGGDKASSAVTGTALASGTHIYQGIGGRTVHCCTASGRRHEETCVTSGKKVMDSIRVGACRCASIGNVFAKITMQNGPATECNTRFSAGPHTNTRETTILVVVVM